MNPKSLPAIVIVAMLILQTTPAAALSIGSSLSGDIETGTGASAGGIASSNVNVQADASVHGSVSNGAKESQENSAAGSAYIESGGATASSSTEVDRPAVVSVTRTEPGLLFWFIPVSMDVTANVDANGNVTLMYPWYAFLVRTDPTLQTSVQARVRTSVAGGSLADINAYEKAQLESTLSAALARSDTSANSSADVSTH